MGDGKADTGAMEGRSRRTSGVGVADDENGDGLLLSLSLAPTSSIRDRRAIWIWRERELDHGSCQHGGRQRRLIALRNATVV